MKIAVVGNCQGEVVAKVVTSALANDPTIQVKYVISYDSTAVSDGEFIAAADLVIDQVTDMPHRNERAAAMEASRGRRMSFPLASCNFLYPFSGKPHPLAITTRSVYCPTGFWEAQVSDTRLLDLMAKHPERAPSDIAEMYLELDYDKIVNLDDLFRLAKQKAERAGRISGLNLWPRIEGMFRFQPLFWTSLHPMEQVLQPICRFVLESLDLGLLDSEIATAIAGVGSLDFAHMPVHPSIVRHFGIEWAGSEYKYRFLQEGAYTAREYAERFIRFDHDDDLARGIYNLHCINDVAGGLTVLQEALKRHPGSGDLMMNIAVAHFRLGDVPNAFRMAIDALATDPKRPEWSTFVCHIARLIRADLWAAPAAALKPKPAVVQQPSPAAPPPPPSPATAPLTLAQLLDKLVQWPLPPPRLRFLVAGTEDERPFIELGQNGFTALIASLREVGIDPASLSRVLEFGCGVGRVLRYWSLFPSVEVHGTDIAPEAIAWARQNLTFGHFATNALQGPLNYPEEQFDLVYALSVFTHLPVEMQGAWFRELLRIVRPGGLIYITMHGAFYRFLLSPEQAQIFDAGELVVTGGDRPGSNICAAFHPWAYVEREFIQPYGMEVLQFLPKGARGNPEQDSLLLRKPA